MLFSNKKEEVIDLKLTVHGRRMLAQGKLKPVYYAFYDDNIIYDSARVSGSSADPFESLAGNDTTQNDRQKRIKEDSPYLKAQHNFSGREIQNYDLGFIPEKEKNYILNSPLGKVDQTAFKSPAWQITFLHSSASSAVQNFENSAKHQLMQIPQIETEVMYETAAGYVAPPRELPRSFRPDPELSIGTSKPDGTYVAVQPDYILLDVEEKNSVYMVENYDIEIYESGSEGWNKLDFVKKEDNIVDGFLVDKPSTRSPTLNYSFVEYYFDVLVDKEIPENLICRGIEKLKTKNIFIDTEVECPDVRGLANPNPYISDTPESECP